MQLKIDGAPSLLHPDRLLNDLSINVTVFECYNFSRGTIPCSPFEWPPLSAFHCTLIRGTFIRDNLIDEYQRIWFCIQPLPRASYLTISRLLRHKAPRNGLGSLRHRVWMIISRYATVCIPRYSSVQVEFIRFCWINRNPFHPIFPFSIAWSSLSKVAWSSRKRKWNLQTSR